MGRLQQFWAVQHETYVIYFAFLYTKHFVTNWYCKTAPQPVCLKTVSGVPQSNLNIYVVVIKYLSSFANLNIVLQFCAIYICKLGF